MGLPPAAARFGPGGRTSASASLQPNPPPSRLHPWEGSMRRTAYLLSAWTLMLAACGPAAAPPRPTAPAAPAATPSTAAAPPTDHRARRRARNCRPPRQPRPHRRRTCPDRPRPSRRQPATGGRGAGGPAQDPVLAGADHPQHPPGAGTKDYDAARLILEPLAASGPDGKPVAAAGGRDPDRRQRRRLART